MAYADSFNASQSPSKNETLPLAEILQRRPDLRIRARFLKSGDYALGRAIGIEYKSAADFAASIVDGRLFTQARRLAASYARPLFLVEGDVRRAPVRNVTAEALRGAWVSLSAVFRIPVLLASSPQESAELIAAASRQFHRAFEGGYARAGYRPRGLRKRRLFILQGFPRVGPRRAAALLDHFDTIEAIVRAEEDALRRVHGIGASIARSIRILASSAPADPLQGCPQRVNASEGSSRPSSPTTLAEILPPSTLKPTKW